MDTPTPGQLLLKLNAAPTKIVPYLLNVVKEGNAKVDDETGKLLVTVDYDVLQQTLIEAERVKRKDLFFAISIMTAAMTAVVLAVHFLR